MKAMVAGVRRWLLADQGAFADLDRLASEAECIAERQRTVEEFREKMQNSIDTLLIVPQYLGL
jgi:hypothetical protein